MWLGLLPVPVVLSPKVQDQLVIPTSSCDAVPSKTQASPVQPELNAATGGWGLHLSNPVQRAWRDANAVARHVSLNWDAVGTMYGQHVFGLEPKGQY